MAGGKQHNYSSRRLILKINTRTSLPEPYVSVNQGCWDMLYGYARLVLGERDLKYQASGFPFRKINKSPGIDFCKNSRNL